MNITVWVTELGSKEQTNKRITKIFFIDKVLELNSKGREQRLPLFFVLYFKFQLSIIRERHILT